ncbi:hypothetical protein C7S18_17660 [Ahniella affigens]|uniref:Uncharacterized protein n=1 Tax=Ahniella affigens TaxID=2021234 RepID=A0A2P1PVP0_9GAMM|nr:hypothetical protein [Ahniella affigens]AVP98892.1 hypothetical protein C7S18_17660 [Ahniella affigens]
MSRGDCSGTRHFGSVRVTWSCPGAGRVCTVEVFWLGQLIMSVPMSQADPVQTFSVTTEPPASDSVSGEFRYGPAEGMLQMVWLNTPEGSWQHVLLCPEGVLPPPPPYTPWPPAVGASTETVELRIDPACHDLFPFVFLKQWPNIDTSVRADNFVDYPNASMPTANSLYANLLNIHQLGTDVRNLSIAQGLDFLAGQPPYQGERITREQPLDGLPAQLAPLWRGLQTLQPLCVDRLIDWLLVELGVTWTELYDAVQSADYAAQIDRTWQNVFALMLVPGYALVQNEELLKTLIIGSLLTALADSVPTMPPAMSPVMPTEAPSAEAERDGAELAVDEPVEPADDDRDEGAAPLPAPTSAPMTTPRPSPAVWPPSRLEQRRHATVVLPPPVFPLPPDVSTAPNPADADLPMTGVTSRVSPYAVGQLQIVRRALLRYEPGEVASIENVMPGERKVRIQSERQIDRQLDERREQQSERTSESVQADASAFELAAQELLLENYQINYSVNYGPPQDGNATGYWTFGPIASGSGGAANADAPAAPAQTTNQTRTSLARSITQRAARRIEQQIGRLRQQEFTHQRDWSERHTFDRRHAETPLRGVYRWLNAIYECWVAPLGERLVLELVLPDPARSYVNAELDLAGVSLTEPILPAAIGLSDFTQVSTDPSSKLFYATLAATYGLEQFDTPPQERLTIACAAPTLASLQSGTLTLPADYEATKASVTLTTQSTTATVNGQVGQVPFALSATAPMQSLDLAMQSGSLAWAASASATMAGDQTAASQAVAIEVQLDWADAAKARWQAGFYAALLSAYRRQLTAYLNAANQAPARVQSNTLNTRQTIQRQLKRAGLRAMVAVALAKTGEKARVERFLPALQDWLERALEWSEMSHQFVVALDDQQPPGRRLVPGADASMTAFLEAAQARVLLPVRPSFERAMVLYLDAGVIWTGEPALTPAVSVPLSPMATSTSIDLLEDLKQAQERCRCDRGRESVGPPWVVTMPTTLVVLQEGPVLPTFPGRGLP